MTYGFEARNSAGEIVIDNSSPVYELGAPSTITSNLPNSDQSAWSFPLQPNGTLRFWELNVGDGISLAPDRFVGTKQTFNIRDVVPASSLPDPTGYGMAIYGASGQKIYSTNGDLLTIGDKYAVVIPFGATRPPIPVIGNWVAIETFQLNIISAGIPGGGGQGVVISSGVGRTSSTEMNFYGQAIGSAPEVIIINPVTFITAK